MVIGLLFMIMHSYFISVDWRKILVIKVKFCIINIHFFSPTKKINKNNNKIIIIKIKN